MGGSERRVARVRQPVPAAWAITCAALLAACSGAEEPAAAAGRFTQRGATSGVDFVLDHGGCGAKEFTEIVVGGVSLLDYDGDGDLDLFCAQGAALTGRVVAAPLRDALYRNDGGWRFTDVTEAAGAWDLGYTYSASCPDVDGDGDLDLFLCNYGRNTLLVNDGQGRFADVTEASGLADAEWSVCAAFVDLDRDGDLDCYVGNYVDYDVATAKPCGASLGAPDHDYCHPDNFRAAPDQVLRNDGGRDGAVRFVDVTADAGAVDSIGKALAIVPTDYDGDGDLDLFVANDHVPNFLWRNDSPRGGPIRLVEVGGEVGVAQDGQGKNESCMGSDAADVDRDGDFDLFTVNMAMETNTLWVNDGGWFVDDTDLAGLGAESYLWVGFGAKFLDQDLDGEVDLLIANGHVLDRVASFDPHQSFAQQAQLYRGKGRGKFERISQQGGPYFEEKHVGRGLATGDLDGDGDVDAVIAHWQERPELLENGARRDGRGPEWIGVDLRGKGGNTRAIGARVECATGDFKQLDEVRGVGSYAAWNDTRLVFGLAGRAGPVALKIRWPDGTVEQRDGLARGRYHRIEQR